MKKYVCILMLSVMGIFSAIGQETEVVEGNKTTFGIKGGLNFSFFRGTEAYDETSFYGGFFAETRLSQHWSFQNELSISSLDDVIFAEVPLLAKYHFNEKWSVFGGARLDFNLRNVRSQTFVNDVAQSPNYNVFGLSGMLGVQYNISKRLFVEGSHSMGLSNNATAFSLDGGKKDNLRFGIGFKF